MTKTSDLLRQVRPTDVVLAVVLSALGVLQMVGNTLGGDDGLRIDSTSWLMIPVFLLATLPVLFRRVDTVAVIMVSIAALTVHLAAFGWVTRCGAGLPLCFVLAYSAGRLVPDRGRSLVALVLTIALQGLVLVKDSSAGLEILPVTVALGAVAWGLGWFVTSRLAARTVTTPNRALTGTRA